MCIHKYQCECHIYIDKNLPCPHIHAVAWNNGAKEAFLNQNEMWLEGESNEVYGDTVPDFSITPPISPVKFSAAPTDIEIHKKIIREFLDVSTESERLIIEKMASLIPTYEIKEIEKENKKRTFTSQIDFTSVAKKKKFIYTENEPIFAECLSLTLNTQNKSRLALCFEVFDFCQNNLLAERGEMFKQTVEQRSALCWTLLHITEFNLVF